MRKLVVIAVVAIAWWMWRSPPPSDTEQGRPHAMVTVDGFAVVDGPDTARVMIELGRDGTQRSRVELPPLAPEIRVVGTGVGTAAVWIANRKIQFQMIGADGSLGDRFEFGNKAKQLCEGTSSTDNRFGVGWLENDGRIWFVHGPVAQAINVGDDDDDAPKPAWCGIASADDDIALLWPDGNSLLLNLCDKRRCSGTVAKIKLVPDQIRGFGCAFDGCLFATSDGKVSWFTVKGKKQWTRDLPGARAGARVSIVGGKRRYAVGYLTSGGAAVARFDLAGNTAEVWRDDAADQAPVLALARDRLAITYHRASELQHRVIALP